jgi:hypothetical protein
MGCAGGLPMDGTFSFQWGDDDRYLYVNYDPSTGLGVECRMPGVEDDCVFTFDVDGLEDDDYEGDEDELLLVHEGDVATIAAFIAHLTA